MSYKINGRLVIKPPKDFVNVIHTKTHNGMAYRYVVNAVKKIGRPLNKGEVVHHIDENISNDTIDNLMVFKTNADHTKYHRSGFDNSILVRYADGTFSVRHDFCGSDIICICFYCGRTFNTKKYNHSHSKRVFCSTDCLTNYKRRNIPSKDALISLLKICRLKDISKKYNVAYNTVKKWCIGYNIDYKSSGS